MLKLKARVSRAQGVRKRTLCKAIGCLNKDKLTAFKCQCSHNTILHLLVQYNCANLEASISVSSLSLLVSHPPIFFFPF